MDSSGSAIIQSLPSDTSYWTSATLPLDYFGDNSTWSDPAQLPSSSSTEYTPTECSLYDWHADTTFNMDIEDCTGPKLRLLAPATDLSITIQEHTPQKPCPFTKTETKRIVWLKCLFSVLTRLLNCHDSVDEHKTAWLNANSEVVRSNNCGKCMRRICNGMASIHNFWS